MTEAQDPRQELWDAQRDAQPTISGDELARKSRRSVLTGVGGVVAALGGWKWFGGRPTDDGALVPLRKGLEFNEAIWSKIGDGGEVRTFSESDLTGIRVNGLIGLRSDLDRDAWRLRIENADGELIDELDEAALADLAQADQIVKHKCVEGWSATVRWTGPTVATLLEPYADQLGDWDYAAFVTPDEEYYVGLDNSAAMHPQTVLATSLDGEPLSLEHGAPVRLAVPIAYGIKSLKRVGTIRLTNERPPDYWAERGYDWYSLH